jgi:hypothetical protein
MGRFRARVTRRGALVAALGWVVASAPAGAQEPPEEPAPVVTPPPPVITPPPPVANPPPEVELPPPPIETDPAKWEVPVAPPVVAPPADEESQKGESPPYFPLNFSFLYPMSTNAGAPDLWTHLDIAILFGRVGFLDGLQVGAAGWTVHDMHGAQIGFGSIVGGSTAGAQIGAGFTFAHGPLRGLQLAGIFGWADSSIEGMQVSGVANQTSGSIDGVQAATLLNVVRGKITGVQLAGAVNQANEDLDGVQASAGFNIALRQVTGVQIGGLMSVGRVEGVQIGALNVSQSMRGLQVGIVNVARNFKGLQIGVVNVTDDLEGESLGIAPLPRRGGIHAMAWASNSLYGNVGIKFASRYAYSILSGALHSVDRAEGTAGSPREIVYGGGLTMGATVRLPLGFSVSSDIGGYRLFRDEPVFSQHDELYKLRLMVAYQIARRLTPFVGGGANLAVRGEDPVDTSVGGELCVGLEL